MILMTIEPQLHVHPGVITPSPGRVLRHRYMAPWNMTVAEVVEHTGISFMRLRRILNDRHPVTAIEAVRFADLFQTSALYWLVLQAQYDLQQSLRLRQQLHAGVVDRHPGSPFPPERKVNE